jgi:K+-transporting ATPase ATPase C chain
MRAHLRASLWLLVLTLILCSVLYPLSLWAVGQTVFLHRAEGSLVDAQGKPVTDATQARGSLLIGQPFQGDEYFQPRPSNAGNGYDAAASGASNWGPSNPKLRARVARQLGPMVKYRSGARKGEPVGPDIETWLTPARVLRWAEKNAAAAGWWIESDKKAIEKLLTDWEFDLAMQFDLVLDLAPADLVVPFFTFYAAVPRNEWSKDVKAAVQAVFFDAWLQDHRDVELHEVPADMVMASASGLDPHITLKNAQYQLEDRVADAWAKKLGVSEDKVRKEIGDLLQERASAPFGGLAGVPLVNVLEVNLELPNRMQRLKKITP